jgi:aldose 1-epimerase
VVLPASRYWVLQGSLPTGEVRPVDDRLDFRTGQAMSGLALDDVLTGLDFTAGRCLARLIDRNVNAEFHLGFDSGFRELVVFTPPGQPGVLAVEPYTQTTDAIHLEPQGIDAGLRVLKSGEKNELAISMETTG